MEQYSHHFARSSTNLHGRLRVVLPYTTITERAKPAIIADGKQEMPSRVAITPISHGVMIEVPAARDADVLASEADFLSVAARPNTIHPRVDGLRNVLLSINRCIPLMSTIAHRLGSESQQVHSACGEMARIRFSNRAIGWASALSLGRGLFRW